MLPCLLYHAPDSCPRLFNESYPVKKVGYERIPSHTASAEFFGHLFISLLTILLPGLAQEVVLLTHSVRP